MMHARGKGVCPLVNCHEITIHIQCHVCIYAHISTSITFVAINSILLTTTLFVYVRTSILNSTHKLQLQPSVHIRTTDEAGVFELFFFSVLFCSEVSKRVNDHTKDEVLKDDYYDSQEEGEVVHHSQEKERLLQLKPR